MKAPVITWITRLVIVAAASQWAWGCGESSSDQLLASAREAARKAAADSAAATDAATQLGRFLAEFPDHPEAAEALKMLAMLTQQRGDMAGAIAHYERLLRDYPDSDAADEAQFMIGFICEEHLRDFERARQAYQRVIDRYPDSELAANARRLLPHVGQPPEEWVRFQEGTETP
ncbi:MAG: tetratricopeptide repeat protein [Gemmatimonadota bacterium]